MTQKVKVTFGNVSHGTTEVRVFESRNNAFMWLNHKLVRVSRSNSVNELYFRIESYSDVPSDYFSVLPF